MTKPFKIFLKAIGALLILFIIALVILANIGRSITIYLDFTESSLTMEQRIEDFEQLCDTLENGLPQLKMYDSKYEWNYELRKNTAPPHKSVEVLLCILIIFPTASSDTRRVKLRYACEKVC